MSWLQDASTGISGAWRLMRLDPRGMTIFERSVDECRRSFMAAVILFPVVMLIMIMNREPAVWEQVGTFRILAIETIGYVVRWTFFPLAALPLCTWLGRGPLYPGFITAYNWAQVLETLPLVFLVALAAMGAISKETASLLFLIIFILSLAYEGFIAWAALRLPRLAVFAMLLLDLTAAEFVNRLTSSFY